MKRTNCSVAVRSAALALALVAGAAPAALPGAAHAQDLPEPGDGFTWERVGDHPIDADGLTFGEDGTLWAIGTDGPHRLDLSSDWPGEWVLLFKTGAFWGPLLVFDGEADADTLVATAAAGTRRSLDGGLTWETVYDEGQYALAEVPAGLPQAGRLLTGADRAIGYSDDRGATWAPAQTPNAANGPSGADALAVLPAGAAHAGRVVAGTFYGASYSDDGGETFTESAVWTFGYTGEGLAVAERPDGARGGSGGYRVVMGGRVTGLGDRAWYSDDEGQTWEPEDGVALPEGPPEGVGSTVKVLALGGFDALVVLGRGTVYGSGDGGQTWAALGRAPDVNEDINASTAAVDSAGRLYVGLHAQGTAQAWVYRTAEAVSVASESGPEPEETGMVLAVAPNPFRGEATVRLALARPSDLDVALYDVFGRRAAVLASGHYSGGVHEVALDGRGLASGVYVVRAAVEDVRGRRSTFVRPVTVMR